jgi:thiamine-phosphate pyrophosphorylase
LNAIIDADAAAQAGWAVLDLARACLDGGATFLQLRAKHATGRWLIDTAAAIVALGAPAGVQLIVNDRADIARLAGAAGVHVGQEDLPADAARRIVGPDRIVGVSTHTTAQLDAAVREPVDYIAIGPVFGTASKSTGYDAIGLAMVEQAAVRAHARGLRVVAIGGITLDSAADVVRAGADAVAVIGDLLRTGDPRARVHEYLDRLSSVGKV